MGHADSVGRFCSARRGALAILLMAPVALVHAGTVALRAGPELARGVFLVASPGMADPNFSRTVVLLLEYGDSGAMGVVINRPSEHTLSSMLPEMDSPARAEDRVYIGGPVDPGRILLLLESSRPPPGSQPVVGDIHVSASQDALLEMLARDGPAERVHVFAGYAGWAPGQLDFELARGGWRVAEADAMTVFEQESADIWPELIRRTSGTWVRPEAPIPVPDESSFSAAKGCAHPFSTLALTERISPSRSSSTRSKTGWQHTAQSSTYSWLGTDGSTRMSKFSPQ